MALTIDKIDPSVRDQVVKEVRSGVSVHNALQCAKINTAQWQLMKTHHQSYGSILAILEDSGGDLEASKNAQDNLKRARHKKTTYDFVESINQAVAEYKKNREHRRFEFESGSKHYTQILFHISDYPTLIQIATEYGLDTQPIVDGNFGDILRLITSLSSVGQLELDGVKMTIPMSVKMVPAKFKQLEHIERSEDDDGDGSVDVRWM